MSETERRVQVDDVGGVPIYVDTRVGAFHATANGRPFEDRVLNNVRKRVQEHLRATAKTVPVLILDRPNLEGKYLHMADLRGPQAGEAIAVERIELAVGGERVSVQMGHGMTKDADHAGRERVVAHTSEIEATARKWAADFEALKERQTAERAAMLTEYEAWVQTLPAFDGREAGLPTTLFPARNW